MGYKKFNINDRVKIKLTDLGCKILADDFNKWSPIEKRTPDYYKGQCDENGFYEMQLWCIMERFGEFIGMAIPSPFENVILLKETDLESVN